MTDYIRIFEEQAALCEKHCADFVPIDLLSKLGISEDALKGVLPIHGLRHQPGSGTSGWYIWSGEYSEDSEFFEVMHSEHALEMVFAQYLGLAPGWRFLIGEDGYEDVWFDASLLDV